jgi:hypothetical protein
MIGRQALVARISVTVIMFLLAVYACVGNALGAGHFFNPFGILCLVLTALIWFAWEPIRDGFLSVKNEPRLPVIVRVPARIIAGLTELRRKPSRPRASSPT